MGAQDNTEKIMRSLHVLLSKSEPYMKEPSKVIVNKQEMLDLLSELNMNTATVKQVYTKISTRPHILTGSGTVLSRLTGIFQKMVRRENSVLRSLIRTVNV